MGDGEIIDLDSWWATAAGRYVAAWEQARFDASVADVFGYHAVQLGALGVDALRASRMQRCWRIGVAEAWRSSTAPGDARWVQAWVHADALPFAADSLDLVVLPHTLQVSSDPRACVREVHRVLRAEGRVVITGFNPWSGWGMAQRLRRGAAQAPGLRRLGQASFLPPNVELLSLLRVKDWLQLLGMELAESAYGIYRPATQDQRWLQRWAWLDGVGARWWPFLGAAYCVTAIKKVPALRLSSPRRRSRVSLTAQPAGATTIGASQVQPRARHDLI